MAAFAAACSTAPETSIVSLTPNAGIYKIGEPYQEDGVWYTPHEQPEYDETGIASWYGPNFYGQRTANGEVFDASALTAAHPTLPMPVNVRVTNLDNGRALVLRVNDRGPFARGRIIDVSERAAKMLGFYGQGTAHVRVTYLSRADLPGAAPAAVSGDTVLAAATVPTVQTAALDPVAAAPAMEPVTRAAPESEAASQSAPLDPAVAETVAELAGQGVGTHYYVQAGAFFARENAERLKNRLSGIGNPIISSIDRNGQLLYRVRIGPYDDVGSADAALAELPGLGESGAKIVVDR
jgi:rare lipoprotein A